MYVSMRPMTPLQAFKAAQITSRYCKVHGSPIHIGDPSALGIADITKPDVGEAVPIHEGEVPVFWACGWTPMEVIENSKPDLFIA